MRFLHHVVLVACVAAATTTAAHARYCFERPDMALAASLITSHPEIYAALKAPSPGMMELADASCDVPERRPASYGKAEVDGESPFPAVLYLAAAKHRLMVHRVAAAALDLAQGYRDADASGPCAGPRAYAAAGALRRDPEVLKRFRMNDTPLNSVSGVEHGCFVLSAFIDQAKWRRLADETDNKALRAMFAASDAHGAEIPATMAALNDLLIAEAHR